MLQIMFPRWISEGDRNYEVFTGGVYYALGWGAQKTYSSDRIASLFSLVCKGAVVTRETEEEGDMLVKSGLRCSRRITTPTLDLSRTNEGKAIEWTVGIPPAIHPKAPI